VQGKITENILKIAKKAGKIVKICNFCIFEILLQTYTFNILTILEKKKIIYHNLFLSV